jgi:hypothetical protein
MPIYNGVTNQKGTPAFFTDTFANRPSFGYAGRVFISTDSAQIFEDTGTAWTLIADAGVGGGTLSSVCLNGNTTASGIVITAVGLSSTTGTFSGIVTTPQVKASTSAGLSINGNSGTQIALLGAGGSANMTLYGGLTGTSGSFTSMSVLNAGVGAVTTEFVNVSDQVQINIKSTGGATYTSNSCNIGAVSSQGFYITRGTSGGAIFDINTSGTYSYILPAANGTLALTNQTGSITAGSYFLVGMTAGNGALYWTSNRVTLANYNVGGTLEFEVNGGVNALTLASTGAATFSSTLQSGAITIKDGGNNGQGTLNFGSTNGYFIQGGADYTAMYFYTNSTQRLTILASGSIGIGTTTPDSQLVLNGSSNSRLNMRAGDTRYATIYADAGVFAVSSITSIPLVFGVNDIESARITATGDFKHTAYSVGQGIYMTYNAGATYGFYNNNGGSLVLTNVNVANVGIFNMTTGVYTPTSDINKKKDFEDSTIGLNEILSLKPTLYRMKTDDTESDKELGFIAQEVKEFIPQAYVESGIDEDKFIGLNFNPIVAALVKAIQEQQTQIQELTLKVNAL